MDFPCQTGEQSLSPSSVQLVNYNSTPSYFNPCRELTSSTCWSARPRTTWGRCLTQSCPNILPVDARRYPVNFQAILHCFNDGQEVKSRGEVLPRAEELLLPSGGDTSGVEQAGRWKLSSSLDHHLGHLGWFAAPGSSHLCAIQGQWHDASDCYESSP